MSKKPRHRPANTSRIESMLRWYEVALVNFSYIEDSRDIQDIMFSFAPKPDLSLQEQISLWMQLKKTDSLDDIEGLSQDERWYRKIEQPVKWNTCYF